MNLIAKILLRSAKFRNLLICYLRERYFHEFGYSLPLGNNLWAHLLEKDSYDSFSEIFIQQEYSQYIPEEPISCILDIGANYGYFSLWLQSKYPEVEIQSLMIEPSPKCIRSLKKLTNLRRFKGKFSFLQKAINAPDIETTKFYDRTHMAGSIFTNSEKEDYIEIQTLSEDEVLRVLSPPYDLIKCDVEASEWELLIHYLNLLRRSKYFLLEWHSWHRGGGGLNQILRRLEDIQFEIVQSSNPIQSVGNEGEVGLILAKNLNFQV